MNAYEIITSRRTIRKFKQQRISEEVLMKLIDSARLAPSGANKQPLRYRIVAEAEQVKTIQESVKWAAMISPNGNPSEDEQPVAFIVLLVDTNVSKAGYELELGAAAQNIMLAAWSEGIGSCWLGNIDRKKIIETLNLPERYILNTVIALGYPLEEPLVENVNDSLKYYKDGAGVLHVPKLSLEDVLV